jgi:hypothetical protein
LAFGAVIYALYGPSRARAALPWHATNIQEHYHDFGIIPDFTRLIRANIDEDAFDAFASRLGLDRSYASYPEPTIRWPSCNETWWDPPSNMTGARYQFNRGDDYYAVALYHEGRVYFAATAW